MSDLLPSHPWLGTAEYRVCVAIAGASPFEMIARAAAALSEHAFLELRLDSLPAPRLALPALSNLLLQHPQARLIATCRRREAGGDFDGTLDEELSLLQAAARAGCSIVDLALESAEAMRLEQHRLLRDSLREAGAALLISYHDYHETRDLALTLARLVRHRPDLVKLVSTAKRLADNLPVLQLLAQPHACPLVALAMGEPGLPSRVLGPRAGALFTFGASGRGAETAPGQLTAGALRELYRIGTIGPATRIYGVAGQPIAHSLSPLLHNTAFRLRGVDAVLLPLAADSVEDLLRLTRELPIEGLSITMPLKQAILPWLDRVDPVAQKVGACNTVARTADGALHGYNTDVAGVIVPLERRLGSLKGTRVLVQGAGAAVFGLRDQGAEVWIRNRTPATAAALAAEAGAQVAEDSMLVPGSFDVLINATPSGMHRSEGSPEPEQPDRPLSARLVFDMVYRPLETRLLQRARAEGLAVIAGVEMFLHQGARQFALWTGQTAPEAEMLEVVLEALGSAPPSS